MRKLRNINDVRFAMFQQKYAPRNLDAPLNKILGINPSSMPPCQSVLINKIHRTNCVACLWRRATLPTPCTMKAEARGWSLENGTYQTNGMMAINCHRVSSKSSMLEILQHLTKQTLIRLHRIPLTSLTMKMINTSTTSTCAETNFMK